MKSSQVLLRLVDDYLLVTTNISKARDFLQMMREGHPEYGCTISPDKTKTNFDFGSQLSNVTDPHEKSDYPPCLLSFYGC
jgi:telomerase reverse transcriptase